MWTNIPTLVSEGDIRLQPVGGERVMLNRIEWYLRQLLPLCYKTFYGQNGEKHFTTWRMWLGRCFDITDVVVRE